MPAASLPESGMITDQKVAAHAVLATPALLFQVAETDADMAYLSISHT